MAIREFKLPDVGEGVAEGELIQWLVEVGDPVTEDQPVVEVETDKALVEIPSPFDGTVKELRAEAGAVVPVGTVIITFEVEGDENDAQSTKPAGESARELTDTASDATAATDADGETEPTSTPGGRVFAPPSVRRLARELGVDIETVAGSGPSGRITEGDVRATAERNEDAAAAESAADESPAEESPTTTKSGDDDEPTAAGSAPSAAGRSRTLAAPATRQLAKERGVELNDVPASETHDGESFVTPEDVRGYADAQQGAQDADVAALAARDGEPGAREERIPYTGVRRTIGRAMERSKYTAPHVSHHDSVDVSALVETRASLQPVAAERGVSLTYMPFIMKAVVAALKEFPSLNAALDEENEEIVHKRYYNLGVAVATDAGLMVPVVRNVDQKSMGELATETAELASRARERKITREEMQGGTFTLTNFGAIGGEYATPIINHPEAAILGLGAIEKRPVVEGDDVVARETLPLSLTIDHRLIDGATAAQFTNRVMEYLETPSLLLLE